MGWRRTIRWSLISLLWGGCQWVGGFKDFEVSQGEPGASGASGQGGEGGAPGQCGAGSLRCVGASLQKCRDGGDGYDEVEVCASEALCNTGRENGGTCTTPACGPGSMNPATGGSFPKNRCRGGDVEVCADDQQQYLATDCGAKQCNPGPGQCFDLKVDATEVTVEQYRDFLEKKPNFPLPKVCEGNDRQPDASCMGGSQVCQGGSCDKTPQVCVDWCDAYEFCKWKGKRLCGAVGAAEGMVPLPLFADAAQSEWMNACSSGGQHTWVTGDDWDDKVQQNYCNGSLTTKPAGGGSAFPVGELSACSSPEGAYKDFYDLTGNVAEWENSCQRAASDLEATGEDNCRVRGGSFMGTKPTQRCDADRTEKRLDNTRPDVGFRCCG